MQNFIRTTLLAILLLLPALVLAQEIIPEPESWSFPAVIEHARKVCPNNIEGKPFNEFGLVYSPEELKSIRLSELDALELQKYADIVTHAYPDAVARQIPDSLDNIPLQSINETTVAGLAYISIHAEDSHTREKAKRNLSEIQARLRIAEGQKS